MKHIELSAGTIFYDDTSSGACTCPTVVLLHGIHMNASLWRHVVHELATDHRCVVPTLPLGGHPRPMHDDADLSPTGVARLVAEFLDELDLRDVTLVGNDTGGAIAQLLAVERPERIGRLVLTSCEAFDNVPPGPPGRMDALMARTPGGFAIAGQTMRLQPLTRLPISWGWLAKRPIPMDLIDSWFAPLRGSRGVRRDLRKFIRGIDNQILVDTAERLADFDRPTLLAWSTEDRVMPFEHAERLAALLPSAHIVGIDDSYTLSPLDQPFALAETVRDFVHANVPKPQARLTIA